MALLPVTKTVIPPNTEDDIIIGDWRIQVWAQIIGRGAAKFAAVASHPLYGTITAEGRLTKESAINAVLTQMPQEPNHEEVPL